MKPPEFEEIATLPNLISLTGAALAFHGSTHIETRTGLAETAVGRLLDLVDGQVARYTGQTSPLGEAVDSTLDKLAGLAIVTSEWRKNIAPKPALATMVGMNVFNSVATAVAMKRNPNQDLSATQNGKLAMAVQNAALAAYAGAEVVRDANPTLSGRLRILGHAATTVGVGYFGVLAARDYLRRSSVDSRRV